jgi:3-hydroxyisobutyrate dehydrogenase-like beta-hydroxyacid dehydrogenase
MRIGFIGLGSQGAGMAEMIAKSDHELVVWARRPGVVDAYVELGAKAAATPAALAAECDIVATCVMADKDVVELAEDRGMLAAMRPGGVFVNHATIDPKTARRLGASAAPHGVEVVDAPVSGSSMAARAKSLLVLASGAEAAIDRAMPMFETYGKVFRCGALGNSQVAKLINNGVFYANMAIAHRALRLAERFDIPADLMRAFLAAGSGGSYAANVETAMFTPSNAAHISGLVEKDSGLLRALCDAGDRDVEKILETVADTLRLLGEPHADLTRPG